MRAGDDTNVIVALGDSLTDGITTTINGDDRWSDVLSRRLHARFGGKVAMVNQGIVGNRVTGPLDYSPATSVPGGPAALARLDRDVISLPKVAAVIWLEGINDFGDAGATVKAVADAVTKGVERLRERIPGVRIIAGTLPPALRSTIGAHGGVSTDAKRKALNAFIRSAKLFDAVIDFDAVALDTRTGELKSEMQPSSSSGGPGDKLHLNRAGYAAMADAIDLDLIVAGNN
jgi:lysophospholipase L1-like esterase